MTEDAALKAAVAAYAEFYEQLTPDTIDALDALCAPNIRFRDPFNDVTGLAAYKTILARMFQDVDEPRFVVADWALSGRVAYLRWDFTFKPQGGRRSWHFEGMTEVQFDDQGRIAAHLDHWDSGTQFYARLPLIGAVIRRIRKRLSVPG